MKIVRIRIARSLAAENYGTVQESGPANVPFTGQTGFGPAPGPANVLFADQMGLDGHLATETGLFVAVWILCGIGPRVRRCRSRVFLG